MHVQSTPVVVLAFPAVVAAVIVVVARVTAAIAAAAELMLLIHRRLVSVAIAIVGRISVSSPIVLCHLQGDNIRQVLVGSWKCLGLVLAQFQFIRRCHCRDCYILMLICLVAVGFVCNRYLWRGWIVGVATSSATWLLLWCSCLQELRQVLRCCYSDSWLVVVWLTSSRCRLMNY